MYLSGWKGNKVITCSGTTGEDAAEILRYSGGEEAIGLFISFECAQFRPSFKRCARLDPHNDNPTGRNILITISSSIRADHTRILSCGRAAARLVTLPWTVTHQTPIHIPWMLQFPRSTPHGETIITGGDPIGVKSAGILRWVHVEAPIRVVRFIRAAPISSSLEYFGSLNELHACDMTPPISIWG